VKRVGFSARRSRNRYSAFGQQLNFNFKSLEPIVQVPRLFPKISRLNFFIYINLFYFGLFTGYPLHIPHWKHPPLHSITLLQNFLDVENQHIISQQRTPRCQTLAPTQAGLPLPGQAHQAIGTSLIPQERGGPPFGKHYPLVDRL